MSKIFVDQVDPKTGTSLTLGTSGDTVNIPSGVTLANAGTMTGVPAPTSGIAASAIDSGTIATARLGSGTASSSTFLRGDQTYAAAGGDMTPAFFAWRNSNQGTSDNTWSRVNAENELFDTDGNYDNAECWFKPQTAGKYFFFAGVCTTGNGASRIEYSQASFYKNGSNNSEFGYFDFSSNFIYVSQLNGHAVIDMNGSSDYVQLYTLTQVSTGNPSIFGASNKPTYFGAYKIIT